MSKDSKTEKDSTTEAKTQSARTEKTEVKGKEIVLDPSENLVVAEATLETQLSDGSVMETTLVPKKKKHTGLIASIVIAIMVVLIGIGAGLWYCLYYNAPERVAYDAIHNLLARKSLITESGIYGTIKTDIGNYKLMVSVDGNTAETGHSNSINVAVSPVDANGGSLGDPYKVKLGNVIMSDGVIYIRTEDLANAFDQIVDDFALDENEEFSPELMEMISEILTTVDDEWWQISVPDIIDLIADSSAEAKPAKEFYACMVNVANQDINGELASAYSNNRFILVEKAPADRAQVHAADATVYDVSFNYEKMAGFINTIRRSNIANNAFNCYNRFLDATGSSSKHLSMDDVEDITAEEIEADFDFNELDIQMQINVWKRELMQIDIHSTNADDDSSFSMGFGYQDIEVNAPSTYRPVTELFEDIVMIVMEALGDPYGGLNYDFNLDDLTMIEI